MNNIKRIIMLLIAVVIIVIVSMVFIKYNRKSAENHNNVIYNNTAQKEETEKVKNATMFFTVQSCIEQYMIYITQKDTESLYKLLDETYIQEFNVTQENVLEHVENLSGELTFKAKTMYFEQISDSFYKYYVKGEIIENDIDGATNKGEFNITVNMDIDNMLFSIIPYGYGGIFDEES